MTRIAGFDQMGNRRNKAGTKRVNRTIRRWQKSGIAGVTISTVDRFVRFDTVVVIGAEDRIVCDQFQCDWGPSDDPTDEEIVMVLVFQPRNAVSAEVNSEIARAEIVDLRQWRFGGSLLAQEVTGNFELKPDETAELAIPRGEVQKFARRSGIDLIIGVVSSTTSDIFGVWNADGFSQYDLTQRGQSMREWQGYEFEEIDDCDQEMDANE